MNAMRDEDVAPTTAERLTWAEIRTRFPDEWVVLAEADWTTEQDLEFGSAEVVGHRKSRKEASTDVKAAFEHHDEIACFWTGAIRGSWPRQSPP